MAFSWVSHFEGEFGLRWQSVSGADHRPSTPLSRAQVDGRTLPIAPCMAWLRKFGGLFTSLAERRRAAALDGALCLQKLTKVEPN
jgi:hypothetical protein